MALSLTAEQKSIFEIFSGKNEYIIPPYQRPYSWIESHCFELFEDLKKAYTENKKDGYFLGNIVIAKNLEDRNRLEVIDGQQRLTTLTIIMRVLLEFDTENVDLGNAINIPGGRTGENKKQRLQTKVFTEKDTIYLENILRDNFFKEVYIPKKKDNNYLKNTLYFYDLIKEFSKDNDIQKFVDFFMYDITLLPIQTEDEDSDKAREKALKIFETINNRGLNLSDSDIFKARLYSMALSELEHEQFIKQWKDLDDECLKVSYTINDIFRFYTQIIRAKRKLNTPEIGLREFFTQSENSPFNKLSYKEILNDLFKIIDLIKFFKEVCENPIKYNDLTKWFQLIDEYTNKYAFNSLLVYLYKYDFFDVSKLINFSKNLVRYCYYQGSTSKIKFYLFDLNIKIMENEEFEYYPVNVKKTDFEYFGLLKKGFSLLCLYINEEQSPIYPYYFSKIINSIDIKNLDESWENKDYNYYVDTIGNLLVSDVDVSRHTSLQSKEYLFNKSNLNSLKLLKDKLNNWTYENYLERENDFQNKLVSFFERAN